MPRRKPLAVDPKNLPAPGLFFPGSGQYSSGRRLYGTAAALKPGKIMLAHNEPGCLPHPVQVQGQSQVPAVSQVQGRAHRPVQYPVFIGLGLGSESGVKIGRRLFGLQNHDIPGEQTVQALPKCRQRQG